MDVSDDIKMASVYVSVLKEEEKELMLEILNAARSFIRTELAKRLRMKTIPSISFKLDSSIEYGNKIDKLLEQIKHEDEGTS